MLWKKKRERKSMEDVDMRKYRNEKEKKDKKDTLRRQGRDEGRSFLMFFSCFFYLPFSLFSLHHELLFVYFFF